MSPTRVMLEKTDGGEVMDLTFDLEEAEAGLIDAKRRRSSVAPQRAAVGGGGAWRALRGPCRILRLCVLGLLLPAVLISVPLYMRYHVLHEQQYPVALSDVRLLDSRVSTTWCQRQVVSGNASFNAYLLPETPMYQDRLERVGMTRHLVLSDDMKEYWGFYLLPGSQVHISACSRWPGASLIVIRGHKHLHDCAYIGDDSSEEEDEMDAIEREKNKNHRPSESDDEPVSEQISTSRTQRLGRPKPLPGKSYDDSVRYENFLSTTDNPGTESDSPTASTVPVTSSEALDELSARVASLGPSGRRALRRLAFHLEANEPTESSEEAIEVALLRRLVQQLLRDSSRSRHSKTNTAGQGAVDVKRRGSRHLEETLSDRAVDAELRTILDGEVARRKARGDVVLPRTRREVAADLAGELGADTEPDEDGAFEQGLVPDGIADHRGHINETTDNDRSNDEFWSSFSSSEEALMNCDGLILYLPLTARQSCSHPASASITPSDTFSYVAPTSGYYFFVFSSENEIQENLISVSFSLARTVYNVSQRVAQCDNSTTCSFPLDFFSSEKVVLEVPVSPGKEGPSPGDSADTLSKHWNEEYLIVSTCEPRTSIYLVCVILVPIFIMMFALQKL